MVRRSHIPGHDNSYLDLIAQTLNGQLDASGTRALRKHATSFVS